MFYVFLFFTFRSPLCAVDIFFQFSFSSTDKGAQRKNTFEAIIIDCSIVWFYFYVSIQTNTVIRVGKAPAELLTIHSILSQLLLLYGPEYG